MRKAFLSVAAAVTALTAIPAEGVLHAEFSIVSGEDTIRTSAGDVFAFNFEPAEVAGIEGNFRLLGIRSDWSFKLPGGDGSSMMINTDLLIPQEDGAITGAGFRQQLFSNDGSVDAREMTTGFTERFSGSGLTFSDTIIDSLLGLDGSDVGTLTGVLQASGTSLTNLTDYFANNGEITGKLTLTFEGDPVITDGGDPGPGGGGNGGDPVPEPASVLLWGALAAGGLLVRKRLRKA